MDSKQTAPMICSMVVAPLLAEEVRMFYQGEKMLLYFMTQREYSLITYPLCPIKNTILAFEKNPTKSGILENISNYLPN
jgi:hypothetical protein